MNNLIILPYEIINEILEYLCFCEECNKYKLHEHVHSCASCKRMWCHECNHNNNYLRLSYFEVYIIICHECNSKLRSSLYLKKLTI